MVCKNCGMEFEGKFCSNCGQSAPENPKSENTTTAETTILEAKAEMYHGGLGTLTLTNKKIVWKKSKANMFFYLLTLWYALFNPKSDTVILLKNITHVDTYSFIGTLSGDGGGLTVHTENGKKYKFGFHSKSQRDSVLEYINNRI